MTARVRVTLRLPLCVFLHVGFEFMFVLLRPFWTRIAGLGQVLTVWGFFQVPKYLSLRALCALRALHVLSGSNIGSRKGIWTRCALARDRSPLVAEGENQKCWKDLINIISPKIYNRVHSQ